MTTIVQHCLSIETATSAITGAMTMGRKALHTELAVCLAIFAAKGNTEQSSKQMVTEVYTAAGYDAENTSSRHYKTVNRRVNAAASLFEKIGIEVIQEWVGNSQERRMLSAIAKGLDNYKFDSMDDVLDFCGKVSNRARKMQVEQQDHASLSDVESKVQVEAGAEADSQGKMLRFMSHGVRVFLPVETSSEDMLKIAAKIIRVARQKEQQELQASFANAALAPLPVPVQHLH